MEEQVLELKQNLLNIRNIVIGNRKKIKKVRIKSNTIERISKEKKKNRLKEKLLESSRATGRLITGVGAAIGNVIPKDKKTKLGNALGLFAMFLILICICAPNLATTLNCKPDGEQITTGQLAMASVRPQNQMTA